MDFQSDSFYNEWITDLTRFSFDGYNKNRLLKPTRLQKIGDILYVWNISWDYFFQELKNTKKFLKKFRIFLGETIDLETLTVIKRNMANIGSSDICYTDLNFSNEIPIWILDINFMIIKIYYLT